MTNSNTTTIVENALSVLKETEIMVKSANNHLAYITNKRINSFAMVLDHAAFDSKLIDNDSVTWLRQSEPLKAIYKDSVSESLSVVINVITTIMNRKEDVEKQKEYLIELGGEEFYQTAVDLPKTIMKIKHNGNSIVIDIMFSTSVFDVEDLASIHGYSQYLVREQDIRMGGNSYFSSIGIDVKSHILDPINRDTKKRECLEAFKRELPETLKSPVYGDFMLLSVLTGRHSSGFVGFRIYLSPVLSSKKDSIIYSDAVHRLIEKYDG